jgi:hypothetical protein
MLQLSKLLTHPVLYSFRKAIEVCESHAQYSIQYVCNLSGVNYVLGVADCRRAGDISISGKTSTAY